MNKLPRVFGVVSFTRPLGFVAASLALLGIMLVGALLTFEEHLAVLPAFERAVQDLLSPWVLLAIALVLGLIVFGAAFLFRSARHARERDDQLDAPRNGGLLVVVFVAFALALTGVGSLLTTDLRDAFRAERSAQLSDIAGIKAQQIDQWLYERMIDVQLMATALRGLPLAEVDSNRTLRDIVEVTLAQVMAGHGERSGVALLTADGRYLAAIGVDRDDARLPAAVRRAAVQDKFVVDTIHLAGRPPTPTMVFLQPFHALDDPKAALLVAAIAVHPASTLFKQIAASPAASSSPSSKTLLVQRDGNEIVYVLPPAGLEGPQKPLEFRLPLSTPDLAAAAALTDGDGVRIGRDYRGVEVLSASREARAAGWTVVAQAPLAEVMAPINRRIDLVVALFGSTIVVAGLLLLALRHSQKRAFAHFRSQQERQSRQARGRYAAISQATRDIHMMLDADGRILDANEAAAQAYGYSVQELLRMSARDLCAPEVREAFDHEWRHVLQQPHVLCRTWHKRKDGTTFPVQISTSVLEIDGETYRQIFVHDVTEEIRRKEDGRRLTRLLKAVQAAGGMMLRAGSVDNLFDGLCALLIELADQRFCCVAIHEDGAVRVVASAGTLDPATAVHSEEATVSDLAQRAIMNGRMQVSREGTIALPLHEGNAAFGALLMQPLAGRTSEEEAEALTTLAEDVSCVAARLRTQGRSSAAPAPTIVNREP